jgi:ATP-dependent DNA helicase RecG
MFDLNTPIENLTKVGKTVAGRLKRLGVFNVADLIYYFPFRYDDFSSLKNIADLKPDDIATVKGKIELLAAKRSPRKRMMITECFLSDETGSIKAVWFGQPFIAKVLKNGDEVYFSGKVEGNLLESYFKNPSYEKASAETTHTARLVPIYPLTSGLTQKQIRFLIRQALGSLNQIADWLPADFRQKYDLTDLTLALKQIHFPENQTTLGQAIRRLKFDELLKLHLQNYQIQRDTEKHRACPIEFKEAETKKIVAKLGFDLTDAQRKNAWQILQDMAQSKPMNRLLEGDVGSGKTVVAALAIANAALNKIQSALLAPTEILAAQHFLELKKLLKPINCNVAVLTRGQHQVFNTTDNKIFELSKAKLLKSLAIGEINLLIGTHAIIQETVNFNNLGLVVIDEQHRFGVQQRKNLRQKSGDSATMPHLLSMTATPIPRTLALTIYGDLEISVINQLPPGRKKPITKLVEPANRNRAYEFILEKVKEGRQAYVICPLIEESDKLGVKSATEEHQKLAEEIFPQLKIGLLHGKLKPREKEKIMADFNEGKIDILVATSVVEVGVNVPNASVMMIESAERFGLSQLHQFRGRVNRACHQAYCLLFSETNAPKSLHRLKTLMDCFDGFKLAEEDLKQRGTGDLTGTVQTGFFNNFKIAKLTDVELIEETKKAARQLIEEQPNILNKIDLNKDFHPE